METNKQLIERVIRKTRDEQGLSIMPQSATFAFIYSCIAAIDAERGKSCVCGEPTTLGVVHRTDGPCFIAPTIPEGMALVGKKLLTLAIDLTREAGEEEFSRLPLSDELHGLSLMLSAAQGERNGTD